MFNTYSELPVGHDLNSSKLRTSDVLLGEKVKFSSLLLEERIQNGLSKCGYTLLSPIQKNALPLALTGTSLIAHAKSGTGKTLVYLLTALNTCLETKSKNVQCLVLAPTREIAKQVYDVFKNVACFIAGLNIEYFIGGTPLDLDVIKCRNCNIAIGAPGRMKHLIELGELKVSELQLLVLDEVDALLNNKEFAVLELVSSLPVSRQTIVCTATFSENIRTMLKPISPDIKYVTINENVGNDDCSSTSNVLIGVRQYVAPVFSDATAMDTVRKRNKLVEILQNFSYDQCFIFVNYISLVKSVCNYLSANNLTALWVSSEQNQSTRIATLNKLKMNECRILVTTDLAARGIDVHNVNLVINLGPPAPPEVYIHRMGRAGRYGSEGAVITIVYEGAEIERFKRIVSAVSTDPVDLYVLLGPISTNTRDDELEVTKCLPQSDPDLELEYSFRRNVNVGEGRGAAKKKSKKKKKQPAQTVAAAEVKASETKGENLAKVEVPETKKENAVEVNVPETKGENSVDIRLSDTTKGNSDCLTDISKPTMSSTGDSYGMEKLIRLYLESIKEEMNREESLDADVLTSLFTPPKKTFTKIRFTDYAKPPVLSGLHEPTNAHCIADPPPDASVLKYVSFIRGKNTFLDDQRLPCSMEHYLEVYDHDQSVFTDYISAGLNDLLKDVLLKIRVLNVVRIPGNMSFDRGTDSGSGRRRSLKRMLNRPNRVLEFGQNSEETSEGTQDSCNILQETSNWVLGRSNPYRSPKRTRNEMPPLAFGLGPRNDLPHSGFVKPIPVAPYVNRTPNMPRFGFQPNVAVVNAGWSAQAPISHVRVVDNVPPPPPPPRNAPRVAQPSMSLVNAGRMECPQCHSRFSPSPRQWSSVLQPLRAFVNTETELSIWQNHFNFINYQVRSLPSMFHNH